MLNKLKFLSAFPLLLLFLMPFEALAEEATTGQIAGDNAWMLTSTCLVLLMTIPGVALFYGGLSRKQNVLSTLMHVFAGCCVVTLTWCIIGYSIAYTEGTTAYFGGLGNFMFNGFEIAEKDYSGLPIGVDVVFQATFAIITTALIAGSFAERIKFSSTLVFMAIWSVVVYAPVCYWVWGGGVLSEKGILDFAGGTVVHINCGIAGLVAAIVVGKRTSDSYTWAPHNLIYTLVGASLLWVGWFGFNAGSSWAADRLAGMAMLVTHISAATAAFTWMSIEWIKGGKPTLVGIATGMVAGLATITPAAGSVGPEGALLIGLMAGIICFYATQAVKGLFGIDDSLDVFPVHGVGGIIGIIMVSFVGVQGGFLGSSAGETWLPMEQFLIQLKGILVIGLWTAIASWIILKLPGLLTPLRVTEEEEL